VAEVDPQDVRLGPVTRQRVNREVRTCRNITGAPPMQVAIDGGGARPRRHAWFLPEAVVAIYEPMGAAWALKTVIVKGRRYAWGPDSTLLKRCSERQFSTRTLHTAPEWVQRFAWTQRPGGNPHAGLQDSMGATT
jgi:hypothetical protein